MYDLKLTLIDYATTRGDNKSSVLLNCSDPSSYHAFPVQWKGYINGDEIEFTQTTHSKTEEYGYEFLKFPEKYNHLKKEILIEVDKFWNKNN